MNQKELISVIVPIYNVEQYLEKCINSIIKQTYKNLEIILVNDGSPDNCLKICEKSAKEDKRIKVINKENGGLSDARNKGLDIMTGKYITFVDSDDYIDSKTIEELYTNLKQNNADISICNLNNVYPSGKEIKYAFKEKNLVVTGINKFYNLYNSYSTPTIIACAKLYKSEVFNQIRYPVGKIHEDEAIIAEILNKVSVVSYFDKALYNYFQRKDSITNTFSLKRLDIIEVHEKRIEFYSQNNLENNLLKLEYIAYLKVFVKFIIPGLRQIEETEKLKLYQAKIKSINKNIKANFKLNLKEKIILYIMVNHQQIYYRVYHLSKILKLK